VVDRIDLRTPAVHILKGPRQVGKSTDLKLLVRRRLMEGADVASVIYLTVDLLAGQRAAEVDLTVRRARELAGPGRPKLLLLDEVTAVPGWRIAIKSLWDAGVVDRDVVICTGSSALDLGAEGLPGRRGVGEDHLVLPQSFANFARACHPELPAPPGISVGDLVTSDGQDVLRSARVHLPAMGQAFQRYLRFGGLPAAVGEAAAGALEPSMATRRVLIDSLARDVLHKGAGEASLFALLERTLRSLGSKTNWSRLATEMDVPLGRRQERSGHTADHRTVKDYVEFLAAGYFILVVYFWKRGGNSNDLSRDKKVYFGDPLLHTVAHDRAPGLAWDEAAAAENAVALALYRKYEALSQQFWGFTAPESLHVWQSAGGKEVDFVCGPAAGVDIVEVKYQRRVDHRVAAGISRGFPGRPVVVATQRDLEVRDGYALVPTPLFLWALG